ncbi:MAG: prepilin-type N-terminal cleavage/methylation domain-containing protein [Calditerrivibrio sp.]|nr:prepilin-type N-terminal cleavage/methylation domain-containing protein [Calditerrivibrio sp.]
MLKRSFTLIEMVIVIVLLGVVSSIGIGLLVVVFNGYIDSKNLFYLFYEAKFGVERIDRELRESIPNSVYVSTDNLSVTFVKFSGGSFYKKMSGDKIIVGEDNVTIFVGDNLSIYNDNVDSIYNSSSCVNTDNSSRVYRIVEKNSDNYTLCKNIVIDSPIMKFYIIDEVVTFKKENNNLLRCSSKNFTQKPATENCYLFIKNLADISFKYQQQSLFINDQIIDIYLEMSKNNVKLPYKHKVHVRNTP